ncbi:hypothetical protein ACWF9B_36305 [Streptomyces sp. NPDC055089]
MTMRERNSAGPAAVVVTAGRRRLHGRAPSGRNDGAGNVVGAVSRTNDRGRTVRRTVLEQFPAGGPRGSWPAEEFAAARRGEGVAAEVVMDLEQDAFLVVVPQQSSDRGR